jgi:hypothetical protein
VRSLSIQVHPNRSADMNMTEVLAAFQAIADTTELVKHHAFNNGDDQGSYFNFTFGTSDAKRLWQVVRERFYDSGEISNHMRQSSMAMCSSEAGWDNYLLLHHYDPAVDLDDAQAL